MLVFSAQEVDLAVELILKGELVAFPTETVYGLGAPLFDVEMVKKIFQIKGRPLDNPLIAHLADLESVKKIALDIPSDFYRLAERFFPGPLTIVLKKHPDVPAVVSGGLDTIAVRIPRHFVAQQLISRLGVPVVAPSANLSGKPSSTEARHVIVDFQHLIGGVIDGGVTEYGVESTVISLVTKEPSLLRLGALPRREIELVLEKSLQEGCLEAKKASPGSRYRHYAPKGRLLLFQNEEKLDFYLKNKPFCHRFLMADEPFPGFEWVRVANLYGLFRLADCEQVEEVIVFLLRGNDPVLMDRLEKAGGVFFC